MRSILPSCGPPPPPQPPSHPHLRDRGLVDVMGAVAQAFHYYLQNCTSLPHIALAASGESHFEHCGSTLQPALSWMGQMSPHHHGTWPPAEGAIRMGQLLPLPHQAEEVGFASHSLRVSLASVGGGLVWVLFSVLLRTSGQAPSVSARN